MWMGTTKSLNLKKNVAEEEVKAKMNKMVVEERSDQRTVDTTKHRGKETSGC